MSLVLLGTIILGSSSSAHADGSNNQGLTVKPSITQLPEGADENSSWNDIWPQKVVTSIPSCVVGSKPVTYQTDYYRYALPDEVNAVDAILADGLLNWNDYDSKWLAWGPITNATYPNGNDLSGAGSDWATDWAAQHGAELGLATQADKVTTANPHGYVPWKFETVQPCATETEITALPEVPVFHDSCGSTDDSVDAPVGTDQYTVKTDWDGKATTATVTFTAKNGYAFPAGFQTVYTYTFTDTACESTPLPSSPSVSPTPSSPAAVAPSPSVAPSAPVTSVTAHHETVAKLPQTGSSAVILLIAIGLLGMGVVGIAVGVLRRRQ